MKIILIIIFAAASALAQSTFNTVTNSVSLSAGLSGQLVANGVSIPNSYSGDFVLSNATLYLVPPIRPIPQGTVPHYTNQTPYVGYAMMDTNWLYVAVASNRWTRVSLMATNW